MIHDRTRDKIGIKKKLKRCLEEVLEKRKMQCHFIYERVHIVLRTQTRFMYVEEERNPYEQNRILFFLKMNLYSIEDMTSFIEDKLRSLQEEKQTMKTLGYEVQGYSKYIRKTREYSITIDRYGNSFHACKLLKNQPLHESNQIDSMDESLLEFAVKFEKMVMTLETLLDVNRELRWRIICP